MVPVSDVYNAGAFANRAWSEIVVLPGGVGESLVAALRAGYFIPFGDATRPLNQRQLVSFGRFPLSSTRRYWLTQFPDEWFRYPQGRFPGLPGTTCP